LHLSVALRRQQAGTHERRIFAPLQANLARPPSTTLLLSVCSLNASHCEAVLPETRQVKPRPPASLPREAPEAAPKEEDEQETDGHDDDAGSAAGFGSELGSGPEDEGGSDVGDRRIDTEDDEPYTRVCAHASTKASSCFPLSP
jgi:hypothetical protein